MLDKTLSIFGFGLEFATSDGHDVLIHPVIYMASHGGPLGNELDMVNHYPSMLKIPTSLNAPA